MNLYTIGYAQWGTAKRIDKLICAITSVAVTTLVDIRHAPCASQLPPKGSKNYWPKPWNLQSGEKGIASVLRNNKIDYRWIVELGNPQRNDEDMAVLREHIESADRKWPVNRGLDLLSELMRDESRVCCLLCACAHYTECHRQLIAETLARDYFGDMVKILDLSS